LETEKVMAGNRASQSSPSAPEPFDAKQEIETTEQLRIAIDQSDAGDKVDAGDPAAAPLGTDDEATVFVFFPAHNLLTFVEV
jgi:hypothetical protein